MQAEHQAAHYFLLVKKQNMWVHSWFVIDINKIADISIDFRLNHGL